MDWDKILYQGQRLKILNNETFNTYDAHTFKTPIRFEDDEIESWVALVIHIDRAPICAVLQNDRNGDERFFNLREEASIFPDATDPSAERGEQAMIVVGLAHEEDQLTDALAQIRAIDGRWVSPVGQFSNMFLRNRAITEKQHLGGEEYQVDYTGDLDLTNYAQRQAIQNAHDYPVSLVHGPPGCAKTATSVFIVETILRRNPKAKILMSAPSNDAANALAYSMLQRQRRTGFQFKFTRLRPTAQAESDIYQNPHDVLNDCLFHIQCYQWAKVYKGPAQTVGDFINSFEDIRKTGNLGRNTARKHYNAQRKHIASEVMKGMNVVITTLVHSGVQWLAQNYDAEWLISDEIPSGRTYELMIALMAFRETLLRVVLSGDHKQLGPYYITPDGARAWAVSPFEKMIADGWPCVVLNINYRTHAGLCLHTSSIFYDNQLHSSRQGLSAWAERLLRNLRDLYIVDVRGRQTAITSYAHFFDIEDSSFETLKPGSSTSKPELSLIRTIVKALTLTGVCDINHIMLESGYRAMCKDMRHDSSRGQWDSRNLEATADIRTIHGAQGSEKPVTILNLTKSGPALRVSAMTGARLVNVATSRMNDF